MNAPRLQAKPTHHPSIEQLIDYSAGNISLSHALCVAVHLEYCQSCSEIVTQLNNVGSSLFESLALKTCSEQDKNKIKRNVLKHIHLGQNQAKTMNSTKLLVDDNCLTTESEEESRIKCEVKSDLDQKLIPQSLLHFLPTASLANLKWQTLTSSISIYELLNDSDGSNIALSKVKKGGRLPHHSHTGDEITIVIKGGFSDEDGTYHAGDFLHRSANKPHTPVVSGEEECICLMLLDAPIQFTGILTKLLNPFLRYKYRQSQQF